MKLGRYVGLVSLTGLFVTAAACSNPMTEALQTLADAGPGGDTKGGKSSSGSNKDDDEDEHDDKDESKPKPSDNDDDPPLPPAKDGGSEAGPPVPGPTTCLDPTPINAGLFPYKKARVTPGACTNAELNTLSSYFTTQTDNGVDPSVAQWSAQVSARCAQCVFSDGTGTTWTPIITAGDQLSNVNRGGCLEVKSGKESCGRAYQQATECRVEACLSLCQTQSEFNQCLSDTDGIFGPGGPCKPILDVMSLECGANFGAYETACQGTNWSFEGSIKAQCINGN